MSLQLFLADKIVRFTIKRRFRKHPDIMTLRAIMEEAERTVRDPSPPVTLEEIVLGGVKTERLSVPGADTAKAILYIHGGGFVGGTPRIYRQLTARLAKKTNVPVYAIFYRLAPEHPFPAGLEDCIAAYRALLTQGIAPGHIAIGGDSAGGNLTLTTALKLKAEGTGLPGCLFCLSAVTGLAEPTPAHSENAKSDAMFDAAMVPSLPPAYCPNHDLHDPLVSPLYGDVSGFPPALFLCSQIEMLRDDSIRMAEKMKAAGADATVEVWPKTFHIWPIVADMIPESSRAANNVAAFISERLA